MSDELRAAAEDVLRHTFYDSSGIGMKAQAVAEAYLAEHPADDDLRLTLEEAEQAFGDRPHIDATVSTHKGIVSVKLDDWITAANRGDLRHLLSILPPF